MRALLLAITACGVGPAFADDAAMGTRIGLRAGAESSSTVTLADRATDQTTLVMTGLDVDRYYERLVLGAGVSAGAAPPFGHAALRASVHAGAYGLTTSTHTAVTVGAGMQWLDQIGGSVFPDDPRGSSAVPFAELRGEVGRAGEHVEVSLWGALLVDLTRETMMVGGSQYEIGGFTVGAGLTLAYVTRRSSARP